MLECNRREKSNNKINYFKQSENAIKTNDVFVFGADVTSTWTEQ